MLEGKTGYRPISAERERLFNEAEKKLHFTADVYALGDRFEALPPALADVRVLDVTRIPGCHYGLRNVFVPIIRYREEHGILIAGKPVPVSPNNAILVETSTGNGWVAFSDAAEALGYKADQEQHIVIMPEGLPSARSKHPEGRPVKIIKTPAKDYARGMRQKLVELLKQNPERLARGEKIYVSPDHSGSAADITIIAMSELGVQLIDQIGDQPLPIRVVVSMGNGSSLCALGEYIKEHASGFVVATESFACGEGYNKFAILKKLQRYKELYGIDPENEALMETFSDYGTNAPFDITLPLQERAMSGNLIDDYVLYTNAAAMALFRKIAPPPKFLANAEQLPNRSKLPQVLIDRFGNSSLGNIATATRYTRLGEVVIAMAYDGRENYR